VKAELFRRERKPWRVEGPGELSAGLQSKPLSRVANSCVEQNPEGGGCALGLTKKASLNFLKLKLVVRVKG
jgi:hypothetical protein